jgi:hypothetical protein
MSLQSLLADDLLMPLMPMIRQEADHPSHDMHRASRPGRACTSASIRRVPTPAIPSIRGAARPWMTLTSAFSTIG